MDHKIGSGARCAMIGYGSWATALAKVLTENEPSIGWYVRNPEVLESLRNKGRNPRYLSNVRFDRTRINPSDDLDRVVSEADIVILASPSAYLKKTLETLTVPLKDKFVISAIKGIVPDDYTTVVVYTRSLWPIFQATGHHHRPLPCRRGFARTALLPYGGLHRSGKFAYDRTQIRH